MCYWHSDCVLVPVSRVFKQWHLQIWAPSGLMCVERKKFGNSRLMVFICSLKGNRSCWPSTTSWMLAKVRGHALPKEAFSYVSLGWRKSFVPNKGEKGHGVDCVKCRYPGEATNYWKVEGAGLGHFIARCQCQWVCCGDPLTMVGSLISHNRYWRDWIPDFA